MQPTNQIAEAGRAALSLSFNQIADIRYERNKSQQTIDDANFFELAACDERCKKLVSER